VHTPVSAHAFAPSFLKRDLPTRQTLTYLGYLLLELSGRLEKDFVSWAHACETWEIVMELRHLRYFVGMADAGSLTIAAEQKLHTSQPPLSRQIESSDRRLAFN
jgi:Bacterial regulatory helix-turn-helix protein, lysR family